MSRLLATLALAALLALAPGAALAQPAELLVPAGEVRHGDLATTDRPIRVEGVVEGDVTSWSGPIIIAGAVRGDVVSYTGPIELRPGAEVGGSVLALAGGVRTTDARVAGQLMGAEPVAGGALMASVWSIVADPGQAGEELPQPLASLVLGLIALLLTVACAVLWPRRTRGVGLALGQAPLRAVSVGLLTTALLALLAPAVGALLAMSLVGLPLLPPLLLLLQLPYLFGLAGLARALAERIRPGGLAAPAAALGALALLLPLTLVGAVAPLWSAALFYLAASAGLGAAILSRGGAHLVQG